MIPTKPTRFKTILFLTVLVFFSLVLITVNVKGSRQPKIVEAFASSIVFPFQKVVTNSLVGIGNFWEKYFYLVEVGEENRRLKAEIIKMDVLRNELTEIRLEHKRLLQLLEIKQQSAHQMMVAKIVGFDATNWSRMITIDKGSVNGVKRKMPVVSSSGLIGKIESVARNSSKVLLITDIRNAVDAIVQESRARGVVVGINKEICDMKYVSLEEKIEKGNRLISSGFGGVYPKGLLIGVVEEVRRKGYGLFHLVSVRPSANLEHLEEVQVLLN